LNSIRYKALIDFSHYNIYDTAHGQWMKIETNCLWIVHMWNKYKYIFLYKT